MREEYGADWERRASCQFIHGKPHWDLQALLKTMIEHWPATFDKVLPRSARNLVFELKDWRNHVAHEHRMTLEDTSRLLDTAARLLKIVGVPEASKLNELRLTVLQEEIRRADITKRPEPVLATPDRPAHRELDSELNEPISTGRQNHILGAPSWQSCVDRIGQKFGVNLTQRAGRCVFSQDRQYGVCCLVSKEYPGQRFWWNLRDRQLQSLSASPSAFVAFACGSPDAIALIPQKDFMRWISKLNSKPGADGDGWHIHILHETEGWSLLQSGRNNRVSLMQYMI